MRPFFTQLVIILQFASFTFSPRANAVEGFFRPGFLTTEFDQMELARSVFRLDGATDGSLFFISPKGHFITSRHVVDVFLQKLASQGKYDPRRGFADSLPLELDIGFQGPWGVLTHLNSNLLGERHRIETIRFFSVPARTGLMPRIFSPYNDFVLGQIDYTPTNWIQRVARDNVKVKDFVFTIGYPVLNWVLPRIANSQTLRDLRLLPSVYDVRDLSTKSLEDIKRPLLVSVGSVNHTYRWLNFWSTDADSEPGVSGGPVFDANGELTGILTASMKTPLAAQFGLYDADSSMGFFDIQHVMQKLKINQLCPVCFASHVNAVRGPQAGSASCQKFSAILK